MPKITGYSIVYTLLRALVSLSFLPLTFLLLMSPMLYDAGSYMATADRLSANITVILLVGYFGFSIWTLIASKKSRALGKERQALLILSLPFLVLVGLILLITASALSAMR